MIYQKNDRLTTRLLGLITFAIFLSSASLAAARESSQNPMAQLKRAVVIVTTYDDRGKPLLQGSGFFIDREQVVTNLHVLKGARQIRIETFQGTTTIVKSVLATNEKNDLALLGIGQACPGSTVLELVAAAPIEGESIVVVSSPQGSRWKVTRGNVGMLWEFEGIGKRLQITAAIFPGSSGGPVLNERGQVIGIAALHADSADDLNFAVPVESLKDLQAHANLNAGRLN